MAVAVELWSGETMRTAPDPLLLKQPSIILTMRFLFLSPFSFDVDFIIIGCISAARSDRHLSRQVTCLAAHVRSLKMKMAVQSPQLFCVCVCVLGLRFRPFAFQHSSIVTHTHTGTSRALHSLSRSMVQFLNKHWEWLSMLTGDSGLAAN